MSYQFLEPLQQKSICIYWPSAILKRVNIHKHAFKVKWFGGAVARLATYLSGRSQVERMQMYFALSLLP